MRDDLVQIVRRTDHNRRTSLFSFVGAPKRIRLRQDGRDSGLLQDRRRRRLGGGCSPRNFNRHSIRRYQFGGTFQRGILLLLSKLFPVLSLLQLFSPPIFSRRLSGNFLRRLSNRHGFSLSVLLFLPFLRKTPLFSFLILPPFLFQGLFRILGESMRLADFRGGCLLLLERLLIRRRGGGCHSRRGFPSRQSVGSGRRRGNGVVVQGVPLYRGWWWRRRHDGRCVKVVHGSSNVVQGTEAFDLRDDVGLVEIVLHAENSPQVGVGGGRLVGVFDDGQGETAEELTGQITL
mmetsp:Transcript_65096/g.98188  ORF Transcript_65096/g.98188 Transcript_65096/m.98188 type:complete len:290 (+) Transcript_65096:268-1137(+)